MALKVGGQCEGYGGIFLALQRLLDVQHAWYAEIEPGASQVLAHHFPGVPNHGDITAFDWSTAEPVDVFTSGFPCQPMSNAGKRLGSADERHLWPTGVLPAIRALMPPLAVLENVPGLLTIEDGQVFAKVLADLDNLGYAVSWTTVGACKVGACHHRHRVFIAATLVDVRVPMSDPIAHRAGGGWSPAQFVLFGDAEAVRWPAAGFTQSGSAWEMSTEACGIDGASLPSPMAADGDRQSLVFGRGNSTLLGALLPTPRTSDTNGAGTHGSGGLDLRTAVSMLPTPLASDTRSLLPTPMAADGGLNRGSSAGHGLRNVAREMVAEASLLPTPRASDGEKGGPNQRGSSGDVMLPAVQPERFGKYAAAVLGHELAYGLVAPDPTAPGRNGKPRLAPSFPEWMQGLEPGWLTNIVDRKAALKLAGNGVNPRQAAYALSTLPTFTAGVKALTAPAQAVSV